jgi:hypothetical protein
MRHIIPVLVVLLILVGLFIAFPPGAFGAQADLIQGAFRMPVGESVRSTVQGSALNSTNEVLPNTIVRLRDARTGRIVSVTRTDNAGLFVFHSVEPGMYIAELVGADQSVLAAGQLLNIDPGQFVSTVVKLPYRNPPFGGLFGHTVASAAAVTSAAAAAGVLATTVTGEPASPIEPVNERD